MAFKLAEAFVQLSARGASTTQRAIKAVSGSLGGMMQVAGGMMMDRAASAMATLATDTIKLGADAEQTQVAFETMLGSASQAQETIAELQKFAATTPFQMEEVTRAGKQLLAFGVTTDQLLPTLRSLGDISSGIGAPLGEIAEIFGKAKVQGRLFMEDINQLTGRGIPIFKGLANVMQVPQESIRKLVEEGKVGFPELQAAMGDLTKEGSQFGGMMEKQSQTTAGRFSTMKDSITQSLREIGTDLLPVANQFIDFGNQLANSYAFRNFSLLLRLAFENTKLFVSNSLEQIKALGANIGEVAMWAASNWQTIFSQLGTAVKDIFFNMAESIKSVWDELLNAISEARLPSFKNLKTDLLDGVTFSIADKLVLTKAQTRETTSAIKKIYEELANRENQFLAESMKRQVEAGKKQEGLASTIQGRKPEEAAKAASQSVADGIAEAMASRSSGLAEFARGLQESVFSQSVDKQQLAEAKRAAAALDNIENAVEGNTLRVRPIGAFGDFVASFQ